MQCWKDPLVFAGSFLDLHFHSLSKRKVPVLCIERFARRRLTNRPFNQYGIHFEYHCFKQLLWDVQGKGVNTYYVSQINRKQSGCCISVASRKCVCVRRLVSVKRFIIFTQRQVFYWKVLHSKFIQNNHYTGTWVAYFTNLHQ